MRWLLQLFQRRELSGTWWKQLRQSELRNQYDGGPWDWTVLQTRWKE